MDSLLEDTGGCGPFQFLFVFCALLTKALFAYYMLFMSFGNYNPGWRCLDSINGTDREISNITCLQQQNDTVPTYSVGNCDLYKTCRNVEYNPEASTIITEWDLSCDRSWISSTITSCHMVGVLVGAYVTGHLGDRYGRKVTIMGAVLAYGILSLLTIFSVSWPMFLVLKFVCGIATSTFRFLPTAYCTEFVPTKWRITIAACPTFSIAAISVAVLAMLTKDWRHIHIATVCMAVFCFIGMLWLPRSIRWLGTHNKNKEVLKAVKTMAKFNRKHAPCEEKIQNLISAFHNKGETSTKFTTKHLFRKGVRLNTFVISASFFTIGLTFYVISFGIKSLPGTLYTNLLIIYSVTLSANFGSIIAGNKLGRRKSFLLFHLLVTLSHFGVVLISLAAPDKTNNRGVLVLALIARTSTVASWYITTTIMNELFPTIIRGTINGFASLCLQIGASIAPFLLPNEKNLMYVSYLVMGILGLMCCTFYFFISETADVKLRDTWNDVDMETRRNIVIKKEANNENTRIDNDMHSVNT